MKNSEGEKDHRVKPDDDVLPAKFVTLRPECDVSTAKLFTLRPECDVSSIEYVTLGLDPRVLFHFAYFSKFKDKSAHIGLCLSINATFHARTQRLRFFSR